MDTSYQYAQCKRDGAHEEAHVNYTSREIVSRPTAGTSAPIHEAPHMLLQEGRFDTPGDLIENEAEVTTFIACQHFWTETNAPNHLAHWSSPEQMKASAHCILFCTEQIMNACGG